MIIVNKFFLYSLIILLFVALFSGICIESLNTTEVIYKQGKPIIFDINETFDFRLKQSLFYHFPLWLEEVGTHTRIRVQGGAITGNKPASLSIQVVLNGVASQHRFSNEQTLKQHYTFHPESEYVFWIQSPVHPRTKGLKTLHNFTITLNFEFRIAPEGTGVVKQIIFETFTPLPLNTSEPTPIVPLQDQFSWQVTSWSFGTLFFNTSLVILGVSSQNVKLTAIIEFNGLNPDDWRLIVQQGENKIDIRNQQTLEGILELNSRQPCELFLTVDPMSVSETSLLRANIEVLGMVYSFQEASSFNSENPLINKEFSELITLFQLGLIVLPLLVYYRSRQCIIKLKPSKESLK